MDVQIDYYNITRQQIGELLGEAKAKQFLASKAIFSITVGSNDFLNNYLFPLLSAGVRVLESPDGFINDMLANLKSQLTVIYIYTALAIS